MLNEVKHLAIAGEILPLRFAQGQNDIFHCLTCDRALEQRLKTERKDANEQ